MTMSYILELFKNYDIEYDVKSKTIVIHKAMIVQDFTFLRRCLSICKTKVDNIIIRDRSVSNVYYKSW